MLCGQEEAGAYRQEGEAGQEQQRHAPATRQLSRHAYSAAAADACSAGFGGREGGRLPPLLLPTADRRRRPPHFLLGFFFSVTPSTRDILVRNWGEIGGVDRREMRKYKRQQASRAHPALAAVAAAALPRRPCPLTPCTTLTPPAGWGLPCRSRTR